MGDKYPSPPHGPRGNIPPELRGTPKIGWSGPTNIPSLPLLFDGKRLGGWNGSEAKGSRSRLPISKGLFGKRDGGWNGFL